MFVSLGTGVTLNCKAGSVLNLFPYEKNAWRYSYTGISVVACTLINSSMAEVSVVCAMGESDIAAMKETLRAQQQLLQKLYAELDQEREASATATSEALDMILRLQGEKAAVKMEASHYKRVAEEKIEHAENTLAVFEDLMYQKEMEIASLEFQVQAYKHKLLSLGCDLIASEFDFPENFLEQQNEENGQNSNVRRLNSLPPIPVNGNPSVMRSSRRRARSPSPGPATFSDMFPKVVVENTDKGDVSLSLDSTRKSIECTYETLDSYWTQIKKLDEKVKVISDCKESEGENRENLERRGSLCSTFSQANIKRTGDQTRIPSTSSEQVNHCEVSQDMETGANPSSSVNVHDVFEVPPQPRKTHKVKRRERLNSEAEKRLTKPDSLLPEGMIESHVKHESEKLRGMLSGNYDFNTPSPIDRTPIIDPRKDGLGMDYNTSSLRPSMSRAVSQAEIQKLHQRVERLEVQRISTREEITREGDQEEQLRLLKDICRQLNSIQSEMRSGKTQESPPKSERRVNLDPLQEAMVYFWL
ncbi:hypothetical protein L6164_011559 [Bauhinia variegata]|uniref:Uncharacterized protein n=1 Tax=Bauhinia variegata TaxID=167791 RepID=A0ACB9P744_BAUVA|nr:hypothetical protein L6164_011559 [Bauhinia variegata]